MRELINFFSPTSKDVIEEFHVLAQNYPEKIEGKNTSFNTMDCVFPLELAFGGIWLLQIFSCNTWEWGSIVKNARAVQEIHVTDMGELKGLFLRVANKFAKGCINESDIFMKKEKDGSYSHVLVTKDHPVIFKYSKNLEIIRVSLKCP